VAQVATQCSWSFLLCAWDKAQKINGKAIESRFIPVLLYARITG
jgi:hypothetical protein